MIGQRFGMLRVIERAGSQNRKKTWRCVCDCGGETITTTGNLNSGNSKSCGCEQRDAKIRARTTHGQSSREKRTRIYSIWANMLSRCRNPKDPHYLRWGARGITVCERWHTFENFFADMGDPPDGKTLDRYPDNDGNYCPENCRWATVKQQNDNRRTPKTHRMYTMDGETLCLSDWGRKLGLECDAVAARLKRGWTIKRALTAKRIVGRPRQRRQA